jgi:hypothetical protein
MDALDVFAGMHLPENKADASLVAPNFNRRAAQNMHLNQFTNAVYMDTHAESLRLAPQTAPIQEKYELWLRRFGHKTPEVTSKK